MDISFPSAQCCSLRMHDNWAVQGVGLLPAGNSGIRQELPFALIISPT